MSGSGALGVYADLMELPVFLHSPFHRLQGELIGRYSYSSLVSALPPISPPPRSYQGKQFLSPRHLLVWVSLSGRQALSVDFSPLIFSHKSILHSPGHSCSISSSCSFLSSNCVFSKWLPSARCVLGTRDRSINGGGRSASWLKC